MSYELRLDQENSKVPELLHFYEAAGGSEMQLAPVFVRSRGSQLVAIRA